MQRVIEGDAPLYRLRYKTLGAFIGAHLAGESPRSVQRNALVAGCFTQADLARHGVAWLEAAALYAQAAAGAERPPKAIDLDRSRWPGRGRATAGSASCGPRGRSWWAGRCGRRRGRGRRRCERRWRGGRRCAG
ncbi:MAG: hypothetical protein IPN17_20350 [Deltaproteobacteria bacterium]|nr:hypothetical protein [Deltaproteobacteria bacterium]